MSALTENNLQLLEEKIRSELEAGHQYEAQQYVQSYVARKKKTLGAEKISSAIYFGANQLIKYGATASAGTLLAWFIEDGAGSSHTFKVLTEPLGKNNYCDVQRLLDLLSPLTSEQAGPIVLKTYAPLHILLTKKKITKGGLTVRINKLEQLFARVFESNGEWVSAFKTYIRLNNIDKAAAVLDTWSALGYSTEKPLFFARAVLYLLGENKVSLASELISSSSSYIKDNYEPDVKNGGPNSPALAVWHLCIILSDLAIMPPLPRVDKKKLFGLLYNQYLPLLTRVDEKLVDLLVKTGGATFGFQLESTAGPNPMAMLQGLFGGGMPNAGSAGAPDMNSMMNMMNKMGRN